MNTKLIDLLNDITSLFQGKISNRWLDLHEVSNYTSLSETTIRRAVQRGELRASHSTGKFLFKVSSIERWLNG